MLKVGLTGGIGAGKSAVARILASYGAVVVDSDAVAHAVLAPGTPGLARVLEAFGADLLTADGTLDRAALGQRVFADAEARRRLEAITHPLIGAQSAGLIAEAEAAGTAVLVHDIPLLVEAGVAGAYDVVVVIEAPDAVRLRRLQETRGMDEATARARMAAQATRAQRAAVADVVIDNADSYAVLEEAVERLWHTLRAQAESDTD